MTGAVILVEDDAALRDATVQTLALAALPVRAFSRAEPALRELAGAGGDVIVTDVRMPGLDGFALLERARAIDPDVAVVLITGHGDVPMAVAALQQGAFDFLTKPFAGDHLVAVIRRALERRELVRENRRLATVAEQAGEHGPLIGVSAAMARVRRTIDRLAGADVDVLIEGETGTGKDLAALMLHRRSRRADRPFVAVDCAALDGERGEAELFGHAADSVAHTRLSRDGRIAAVAGGTLLLDGVEGLTPTLQARLLRVIEDRELTPIGADRAQAVSLRIVATSATDLPRAVADGRLRADLYHRLTSARLQLPALRDRPEDIGVTFAHFLREAAAALGRGVPILTEAQRRHLLAYGWPGNVRELRNHAQAVVLAGVEAADTSAAAPLRDRVATFEAQAIAEALRTADGHVSRACAALGLPRKTLYEKMERHGIDPAAFRRGDR